MLTRARRDLLNNNKIAIQNGKVVVMIPILNLDEQVIIVWRNATQYTINRIQIKQFAKAKNRNVILSLVEHLYTKEDGDQIVDDSDFLTIPDGE